MKSNDTTPVALCNVSYRMCGALSMIVNSFNEDFYQLSKEERMIKLNLIAYYIQAWSYAQMDHPLFKDDFIATKNGPALKALDGCEFDGVLVFFEKYNLMKWCFSEYEIDFMHKIINNYSVTSLETIYQSATQMESPYVDHFSQLISDVDWTHITKRNNAIAEYLEHNSPAIINKEMIKSRYLSRIK